MLYRILLSVFCFGATLAAIGAESLETRISSVVGDDNIGVAVITAWGDTVSVNGDKPFELQSVVKFHQALAMAKTMTASEMLNTKVTYDASDLKAGTWSPLRAVNKDGGTADLSTLLYYSLRMCDNNAADILFDRFLSPVQVDSLLRSGTPAKNFGIARTEDDMHKDQRMSADNWSTPLDCAGLFNYAFAEDTTASIAALRAVMASESAFGKSRLVKGIGNGTVFNKTGTGFEKDGKVSALNDAAFVYFPHSTGGFWHYSIAVFAADCAVEETEAKIAEISEIVWSYHVMRANDIALNSMSVGGMSSGRAQQAGSDGEVGIGHILGAAALAAIVVDEIVNRVNEYNSSYSDDSNSGSSGSKASYGNPGRSKSSSPGSRSTSQRRQGNRK